MFSGDLPAVGPWAGWHIPCEPRLWHALHLPGILHTYQVYSAPTRYTLHLPGIIYLLSGILYLLSGILYLLSGLLYLLSGVLYGTSCQVYSPSCLVYHTFWKDHFMNFEETGPEVIFPNADLVIIGIDWLKNWISHKFYKEDGLEYCEMLPLKLQFKGTEDRHF